MSYKRVQTYFHQLHLADRIIDLKDSSATVELATKALGCQPQQIAKTLSFLIDEQPLLIVMAGDAKIDNKKYKQYVKLWCSPLFPRRCAVWAVKAVMKIRSRASKR